MKISALIPTTGDFATVTRHAQLADQLGYESINCSHISARDSFTTLSALSAAAPRVQLGTAVAPIYHRSPASMAQTAATVDDLSGGRFRLGLGIGHQVTMSEWHGQHIGKPLAEMREYVAVVRSLLAGRPATGGDRWRSSFEFVGFTPRADIPIYVAGLSRGMIRLAAEIADGIVLWACPASYVRDVVVPEVAQSRRAAGKDPADFDIVAAVPAAASEDLADAHSGIRAELHRYFGLPFYRTMFATAGYASDIAGYDAAAADVARQRKSISDEFVNDLCAIGDPASVGKSLDRYRAAGATNVMITNIRGTEFEPTLRAASQVLTE
jgi:alkanesulfonate monooxygenase SsuD/methylene tetrahydromethanopterin reductase-like flavin-dependent oxidoreductase (luciferase family)